MYEINVSRIFLLLQYSFICFIIAACPDIWMYYPH